MSNHTIIIGGGLAGLATAAALVTCRQENSAENRVTLLESRPRLGGRATSIIDADTGEMIDNCQHVSMGCCTNFAHFCETIGIENSFTIEDELIFIDRDNQRSVLKNGWGPAPFHLAGSFSRLRFLNSREKRELAFGLKKLAAVGEEVTHENNQSQQSFLDWLQANGQSSGVIRKYWHTVLVSALSESLDRIDTGIARKVFVDGFLRHRDAWKISVATRPLGLLYGDEIAQWFQQRGGDVRLKAGVAGIEVSSADSAEHRVNGVRLRNGEYLDADHVVLAVPWTHALPLLPEPLRTRPEYQAIADIEAAPISSVHLWFDREITKTRHVVFVDRLSQWIFNRTGIHRSQQHRHQNESASFNYQVVISNSRDLRGQPQEETIEKVVAELASVWPEVRNARLLSSRLITEHRAVFSPTPGVEQLRPSQQTPIANLQLAGDWTQTGWPATMEGAVRSGYLAAENILRQNNSSVSILQPDLPAGRLSRILF